MKKILRILIISAVLLTTAIVFTTCKQFIDNPEEFLGYWSSEVVPTDFSIDKPTQKIGDVECIPSYWNGTYSDVTLTIKLHNPRKFSLIMPTSTSSAADVQKIINFPGLLTQPTHGSSNGYTLVQTPDKQALQLTYKSGFLKAHEWSNGSIGPEITLTSTDGRKFGKKFSLNIEVNTAPPDVGNITIAKDGVHYVLCFTVQDTDMNTTIAGGNLHKDLVLVISKENGETTKIPLPIGSSGFAVDSAAELLPSASQITDPVPTGTWKVYFKTDTSLTQSTLPQKYTVRLIDRKGLSSAPKEAHTLGYIPDLNDAGTAWKNLKTAVGSAEAGGVITVMGNVTATTAPGNYGTINVTKSLTIKGKIGTTLDANQSALALSAHRIFTVTGNKTELTLENLTLKNGYANKISPNETGGAIDAAGIKNLTLKHCTITDCKAYKGGGIFLAGRVEAVLESCTITGCTATGAAGGAIYAGNSYDEQPVVRIKGGLINGNEGYITGGAIDIARGSLYIEKDKGNNPTKIENNTVIASGVQGNGGSGISYYWDAAKPGELKIENAEITNCNIKYNSSGDGKAHGAGIYVYGNGKVSLSNVTLNQCGFTGEIPGNEFNQKQGGGICLQKVSTATIEDCTIENSATANEGGGIYAEDTNLTIENTKIQNNRVEKKGGGLYVLAAYADVNLTIKGTTKFENNNVNLTPSDSLGGGIYMKGRSGKPVTAVMTGGEFVSNGAHNGGGIYIDSYAKFTMKGGSLNNNTVPTGSGGGEGCAVYINNNGTFIWAGGTITGHTPNHVIEGNGTFTNNSGNTES